MKRKQSLDVLNLRVSDLLEGLDETEGKGGGEGAQAKFVRFRQKLESLILPSQGEAEVMRWGNSTLQGSL